MLYNKNEIYFEPLINDKPDYMNKIKLLIESNTCKPEIAKKYIKLKNKQYYYCTNEDLFTGIEIKEILFGLNNIPKFKGLTLNIYLGRSRFADKLVYILLECICYYLITVREYKVNLFWDEKYRIDTVGLKFSPLKSVGCSELYKEEFISELVEDNARNHFRRIYLADSPTSENAVVASEILSFLEGAGIDSEIAADLSIVLSEVTGNVNEHGREDCLIDIDITDPVFHKADKEDDFDYYGVNVAIVGFSNHEFYKKLKHKMKNSDYISDPKNKKYKYISQAFENHRKHFGEVINGYNDCITKYTEEDFYSFASFHNRITGSYDKEDSGGTGLTNLIKAIEDKSEQSFCYQLGGRRLIIFNRDFLHYKNDIIGFNKTNDFINDIPDPSVFGACAIEFPGTAYNLSFVIRENEATN